jgi:hypothetical protein
MDILGVNVLASYSHQESTMNAPANSIQITLRIPGAWSRPTELEEGLPEGVRFNSNGLVMPDGSEFELQAVPPDEQFAQVFQSACRGRPTADELAVVNRYRVNVVVVGPGGSMDAALALMQAAAAIVQAGGAGVFIDNSALAHGGQDWLAMAEDGGPDAISFAFAAVVRGKRDVYTMGMHVMGFPDLLMRTADIDEQGEMMVDTIRYVCGGNRPIEVGHFLGDEQGARFQVVARESDAFQDSSPMHNPHGRLKIVSVKEIAEGN